MIYLFANEKFGLPFIASARAFASRERRPLTVVFSTKKLGHRRGRLQALAVLRWAFDSMPMLLPLIFDRWVSIALARDVNGPHFLGRIDADDVGVICGFNQIFSDHTIQRFARLVNVHPSLLPLYRGPIPSYWCLVNRESATGYTFHEVTTAIDAGRILHQEVISIEPSDTVDTLDNRIASDGAKLLGRLLGHLVFGKAWAVTTVNATLIYRVQVDYASWPHARVKLA